MDLVEIPGPSEGTRRRRHPPIAPTVPAVIVILSAPDMAVALALPFGMPAAGAGLGKSGAVDMLLAGARRSLRAGRPSCSCS